MGLAAGSAASAAAAAAVVPLPFRQAAAVEQRAAVLAQLAA